MILNSKALGLLLGLFLFSSSLFAKVDGKLHIAIIDTGFCNKSTMVQRPIDLTNSVQLNCKKLDRRDRRFHGHFVLEKFLDHNRRKDLIISPLIVFDKDGIQKEEYWLKAIEWIRKNKVDIVLTASGLKVEKSLGPLSTLTVAASGQVSGKIRRFHKLWPQSFKSENLILIGSLIREDKNTVYTDHLLLNKERIDYFIEEESSSKAVAIGLAKALNKCKEDQIRKCFESRSKTLTDSLSKKPLNTL